MLEHIVIGNNLREAQVFGDLAALDASLAGATDDPRFCAAGLSAHHEMLFANAIH